jgi:hypothetical protein
MPSSTLCSLRVNFEEPSSRVQVGRSAMLTIQVKAAPTAQPPFRTTTSTQVLRLTLSQIPVNTASLQLYS